MAQNLGIVIVGRNEAKKLPDCFQSLQGLSYPIVYVDSDSTDNSVEIAKSYNAEVIELSNLTPLSAARGRNEGFRFLTKKYPDLEFIQFIDGDTALISGWVESALKTLSSNDDVVILTGQLFEKEAESSFLKTLSQLEWQKTPGYTLAIGGIFMARTAAIEAVGGFNETLKAGEEAELALRLTQKNWKILAISVPMAVHNSAVMTLKDFIKRSIRTGYAFAEVSSLQKGKNKKLYFKEHLSNLFYGGLIPLFALILGFFFYPYNFLIFLIYPLLFFRIYLGSKHKWSKKEALLYATSCTLGKFTEFYGACKFYIHCL